MVLEFDMSARSKKLVDFYNTVYVTSDQASDYTHSDTDANCYLSTPITNTICSNQTLAPQLKSSSERIHTPARLCSSLVMGSNDVFFSDDV